MHLSPWLFRLFLSFALQVFRLLLSSSLSQPGGGGPPRPPRPPGSPSAPSYRSHRRPKNPPRLACARGLPSAAAAPPHIQVFSRTHPHPPPFYWTAGVGTRTVSSCPGCMATPTIITKAMDSHTESEVAMGYTMTQICDKFIEFFMNEKPETKDWRKILVFREEWRRYGPHFYKRCQARIDVETDSHVKQKLVVLTRKVKKIDGEIQKHMELFTELRENPTDINAVVARRRKDFTGEFFRNLNFLVNAYNGLDERDAIARLGAKCLSAIHAYDCTLQQLDIDSAQSKFDDILNSSSLDDACDKIKCLAKAKELDSSLVLLINRAWAAAKDSKTMKNKVKDIMYHIYTTTKESLKIISPPEMKLLKYLLNIEDPEERFAALATAFSPGDEREVKDEDALYTTPNELHKWIKMMLDSYHLNKEETDLMDARRMSDPVIIQRLILLKETVEEEYMKQYINPEDQESDGREEPEYYP